MHCRHQALAVVSILTVTAGCSVGTVTGEIDGRTVPGFSEASFGGIETTTDVFVVAGFAIPGDSCVDGAKILEIQADEKKALDDGDVDEFENLVADHADLINAAVPVGEWLMSLVFIGLDIDDVRDETFDLEKQVDDNVSIQFSLCLQKSEADVSSVDGVATLDTGADCFTAGEGELNFILNADDTELQVKGEKVEMQFDDGDTAGDVDIDFTMTGCPALADGIDAIFEANAG
jgi:hypothetical protein